MLPSGETVRSDTALKNLIAESFFNPLLSPKGVRRVRITPIPIT